MSKTIFKVGMKVYDEVFFPGRECIVIYYNNDFTYSIIVKDINSNFKLSYTYDGRYFDHCIPTLSTTPYTVKFEGFSQEEPLKKGQIVWVRDRVEQKWMIAHFFGLSSIPESEYKYGVSDKVNGNAAYYRFLTTQNPYENIE